MAAPITHLQATDILHPSKHEGMKPWMEIDREDNTEIVSVVSDKLMAFNFATANSIKCKYKFIKATTTEQSKLVLSISDTISSIKSAIHNLDTSNLSTAALTNEIQPAAQTITSSIPHALSLNDSVSGLAKLVEELKHYIYHLSPIPHLSNSHALHMLTLSSICPHLETNPSTHTTTLINLNIYNASSTGYKLPRGNYILLMTQVTLNLPKTKTVHMQCNLKPNLMLFL